MTWMLIRNNNTCLTFAVLDNPLWKTSRESQIWPAVSKWDTIEPWQYSFFVCKSSTNSVTELGISKNHSNPPSYSQSNSSHCLSPPTPVIRYSGDFEAQSKCHSWIYFHPELDTCKFILYFLSLTIGGSQLLKCILLWRIYMITQFLSTLLIMNFNGCKS